MVADLSTVILAQTAVVGGTRGLWYKDLYVVNEEKIVTHACGKMLLNDNINDALVMDFLYFKTVLLHVEGNFIYFLNGIMNLNLII